MKSVLNPSNSKALLGIVPDISSYASPWQFADSKAPNTLVPRWASARASPRGDLVPRRGGSLHNFGYQSSVKSTSEKKFVREFQSRWRCNSLPTEDSSNSILDSDSTVSFVSERTELSASPTESVLPTLMPPDAVSTPALFSLEPSIYLPNFEQDGISASTVSYGLTTPYFALDAQPEPQGYKPKWFKPAKSEVEEQLWINRTINGVLVGAAFSAALLKVVTVDIELWRGWTFFEVVRSIPIDNWLAYEASLQNNPVLAKMCISGVVYSLGDWSAQCCEGRGVLDFDRGRMLRSGSVGFFLHGSLSHYYYHFCEWLFPFSGWWVVPVKVAFDQTIWSGIWNSIYYGSIGLMRMESPQSIFKEIKATFFSLLMAGWKLWPFAHIVTYGVIPVEQRLLWVDMVELVWVTILSTMSNEKAEARRSDDEGVIAEATPVNSVNSPSPVYVVVESQALPLPSPSTSDSVLWSTSMVDQMVVKDVNMDSMNNN